MKQAKTLHMDNAAGFTLIEALLAVVLLGMAASSILLPFTAGAILRKEGAARTLASNLASEQMEKISRTPFAEIVSTWNGHSEAGSELTDGQNNLLSGVIYSSFTRTTRCVYVQASQQTGLMQPSLIHVTVEVTYRGAPLVTLNRLLSE
ncbi:MAG TPA: prepilin-type N-terminal cleavage/methylation domain-containing protein [Sedimentisphaerales bacterium]|nr:prepilin-type N-terminal cleavage/methylation domain-containing protein [Sedimentisphaerales bacterium]